MTLYLDTCLRVKRWGKLKAYSRKEGLEVETYGEVRSLVQTLVVRNGVTVSRTRERVRPKTDYATVRNVSREQVTALRRFGVVLRGYPMRMRELDQKTRSWPQPEKPVCPIHQTDKTVHWIGRDHWTCTADHWPQHFGMLRLT